MWLGDVAEVCDCFLGRRSSADASAEDDEPPDDAGFLVFVWGTEGDGPVYIKALSAEPAHNEGALCLVTKLVSGGTEATFSGAAVSCRGSGICFRRLEPLGVVRAVLLGAFSLQGNFSRSGTGESIARVSGRPSHFQYHSGLLYRKYEPEVWNVRWIGPCSLEFRSKVATSFPRLHFGIRDNVTLPSADVGRTGVLTTAGARLQTTARNARTGECGIRRHLSSHRLVSMCT
jgi:hypothetical protein